MSIQVQDYEKQLLKLALPPKLSIKQKPYFIPDANLLQQAYTYCDSIIKEHSRSFYLASSLLPSTKRIAARVLYAFCRISDNIVDIPSQDPKGTLENWKERTLEQTTAPHGLIALAWHDVQYRYQIPKIYAEQLIDGVAVDLIKNRYENFTELSHYAYGVASTVGLMVMHIIGFSNEQAVPYAIRLGLALQMTNILRDVGEDWKNGRLYLPLDELKQFNLSEDEIERGRITNKWRDFMKFQITRTRKLYLQASPGIRMLHKDGRFAIRAAAQFYEGILKAIEKNDYDVFNQRVYVSKFKKFTMIPNIWFDTL